MSPTYLPSLKIPCNSKQTIYFVRPKANFPDFPQFVYIYKVLQFCPLVVATASVWTRTLS